MCAIARIFDRSGRCHHVATVEAPYERTHATSRHQYDKHRQQQVGCQSYTCVSAMVKERNGTQDVTRYLYVQQICEYPFVLVMTMIDFDLRARILTYGVY